MTTLTNHAWEEIRECDPKVLNSVYPGWGDMVTRAYRPGLENLKKSLVDRGTNDLAIAHADAQLAESFDWLRSNLDAIADKVGR